MVSCYGFKTLWPSGLGNYFVCKLFTIQTLLWSMEFVIQVNLEHDTIVIYSFGKNRNTVFLFQLSWQSTQVFLEIRHLFVFVGSVNSKKAEAIASFFCFVCQNPFFSNYIILKSEKQFFKSIDLFPHDQSFYRRNFLTDFNKSNKSSIFNTQKGKQIF